MRFARELPEESPYQPREALAGKDARTLARELLAMTPEEFSAAFKDSPMKRAKLRGLKRNAAAVLGNLRDPRDVPALATALSDLEPLVRRHAAWALSAIGSPEALDALQAAAESESDETVSEAIAAALAPTTRWLNAK
ncbi:MAG TPA: HEAT repeat domain-containing protein [Burkholderiales bacterium]|nr:HEAT repeat domain-containing protein [Burkholderiales bacterium]